MDLRAVFYVRFPKRAAEPDLQKHKRRFQEDTLNALGYLFEIFLQKCQIGRVELDNLVWIGYPEIPSPAILASLVVSGQTVASPPKIEPPN